MRIGSPLKFVCSGGHNYCETDCENPEKIGRTSSVFAMLSHSSVAKLSSRTKMDSSSLMSKQ